MTVEEQVAQILRSFPDVRQQQVLDFVIYLKMRDASQGENKFSTFFGDGLTAFRHKWQIESLNIDPDEIFGEVRDQSPGREVYL